MPLAGGAVSPDDIRELFSAFGAVEVRPPVRRRPVIYADDTMFRPSCIGPGLDFPEGRRESAPAFDREGLEPIQLRPRR